MKKVVSLIILATILFTVLVSQGLNAVEAQSASISLRQAIIYKAPEYEDTGVELPDSEVADKFTVAIYAGNDARNHIQDHYAAGYDGIAVQYFILNKSMVAPESISVVPPTADSSYCNDDQLNEKAYSNNINFSRGSFCQVQDSIIGKARGDESKKFDHDLDPATPDIWADEDWFVHDANTGERLAKSPGSDGRPLFGNHANVQWQEYFAARVIGDIKGEIYKPAVGMKGIFLDNLDLSWTRLTQNGTPAEFASSEEFTQAEYALVAHLKSELVAEDPNYKLFANMTKSGEDTTQWDVFADVLDGGMAESFVLDWGRGIYDADKIEYQLGVARDWIAAGNHFLAALPSNTWNGMEVMEQEASFGIAAYMLIYDQELTSIKVYNKYGDPSGSRDEQYHEYYDFPEFYYQFGTPLGGFVVDADNPYLYQRDFECAQVIVDINQQTHSIELDPDCGSEPPPLPPDVCLGDYNADSMRDVDDLSIFATNYRQDSIDCELDLQGDNCSLGLEDLDYFATVYGTACE